MILNYQYFPIILLAATKVSLAAAQALDVNAQACTTAFAIISICISASPSLSTATAFSSSASCACYTSNTWAPRVFDNYHASCYSFLSTASPQFVSQATSYFNGPIPSNPCVLAGNILSASRTATDAVLNVAYTTESAYAPCRFVQSLASACPTISTSTTLNPDELLRTAASCFCYGSAGISGMLTAWKPMLFDNSWSACIDYWKTANSVQYTSITASPGFVITPCAKVGDVRSLGNGEGNFRSFSSSNSPASRTSSSIPTATVSTTSGAMAVGCWVPFLKFVVLIAGVLT